MGCLDHGDGGGSFADQTQRLASAPSAVAEASKGPKVRIDRDRGMSRDATPPTPPGIRVTYHGGSTGLSRCRNIESGETE